MNKTQILCNNNNKKQDRILKDCWETINSHLTRLIELNNKKREQINEIRIRYKENKDITIQSVRLERTLKEIEFYNTMYKVTKIWIKDSRDKLVIC